MSAADLAITHGFPITDPDKNADYFLTLANLLNSPKNYWFAQCDSVASDQIKSITLNGFLFNVGIPLNILFTNGNTYGLPASGTNVISAGSGVVLGINNGVKTMYYDIVAGPSEAVGENFVPTHGVHEFIITQAATDSVHGKIYDKSSTILYSHSDSNSSYIKYTDGKILERGRASSANEGNAIIHIPLHVSDCLYSDASMISFSESIPYYTSTKLNNDILTIACNAGYWSAVWMLLGN